MFVMIENDPEGMSEDDGTVAGVPYEREAGESRGAFWSWLRQGETIEIGATVHDGVPPGP
jgi:hypothetical protein